MTFNPWCSAYQVSETELQNLERRAQPALTHGKDLRVDFEMIRAAMQDVFLLSDQVKAVLYQLLAVAEGHALRFYSDHKQVTGDIYSSGNPWGDHAMPAMMLTGLAGVGKSECLAAMRRLLDSRMGVVDLPGHRNLKHVPAWFMSLRYGNTLNSLIRHYLEEPEIGLSQSCKKIPQDRIMELARRVSRRDGTNLAVVDELQFTTHSAIANAQVTSLLLSLLSLGPRLVYVSNFSLGHRLKARRQEDRQRLLTQPILIAPEPQDSLCFCSLVEEYSKVAPNDFALRADDIPEVHRYTFGIKRAVVGLMSLAWFQTKYTKGRKFKVGLDDIRTAYLSRDFETYRNDVELLWRQSMGDRGIREDLVNPFTSEHPEDRSSVATADRAIEEYRRQVAQAHLDDLMTPNERAALTSLQQAAQSVRPSKAKVVNLKKKTQTKDSMLDVLDRL